MPAQKEIKKVIATIKEQLIEVGAQSVADKLNCTRQNLYFHLNKSLDKIDFKQLNRIMDAIKEVRKDAKSASKEDLNILSKKLKTEA